MTKLHTLASFLYTTAIGGLLFLLPLIVVGALVGQVVPIVLSVAKTLGEILPAAVKSIGGVSLLIVLAVLLLLLLCFGAGVLARMSLSRTLSQAFERKLVLLFPRYAILKDQMADSIGGAHAQTQMKPVLVNWAGLKRIAFETERSADGQTVSIYLPGSPDPWAGSVAIFAAEHVEPLDLEFGKAVAICEQLGRGATTACKH